MRKSILIVIYLLINYTILAQLINIKSDTVCFGDQTNLVINNPEATQTYYWDLDNDGFYDDAIGTEVNFVFDFVGDNHFKVLGKKGVQEVWTSEEKSANVLSYPDINIVNNTICNDVSLEEASKDWDSIQWKIDGTDVSLTESIDSIMAEGTYIISIEAVKLGCEKILFDTLNVQVPTTPLVSYPALGCVNDSLIFDITNSDLYDQLLWKFSNKTQLINKGVFTFDTIGTINYELFYKEKNITCKQSITGSFVIQDIPHFVIETPTEPAILGDIITIYPSVELENPIWNDSIFSHTLDVDEPGVYTFKQSNEFGCSNSQSVTIDFLEVTPDAEFNIVNEIVTPFDDGVNDFFLIENAPTSISLKIFARDGQEVYSSSDYQNDWNGLFNGKKLPSDSYLYQITYADKVLNGTLHLIYK